MFAGSLKPLCTVYIIPSDCMSSKVCYSPAALLILNVFFVTSTYDRGVVCLFLFLYIYIIYLSNRFFIFMIYSFLFFILFFFFIFFFLFFLILLRYYLLFEELYYWKPQIFQYESTSRPTTTCFFLDQSQTILGSLRWAESTLYTEVAFLVRVIVSFQARIDIFKPAVW